MVDQWLLRRLLLVASLFVWTAVSGCGGSTPGGQSTAEPTECPTPVNLAPPVTVHLLAEDPPVIDGGGPIVDGTYFMTESLWFTGPGGAAADNFGTYRDTIVIANAATGIARVAEVTDGGQEIVQRFTMRSAGSMLEISDSCPTFAGARYTFSYTAAGSTLAILYGERLLTFTRQ